MIGSSVGPYQVLEKLGAGGMGEVFLGFDSRLHRRVALKCLTISPDAPDHQARIFREARAAARLNHPNIAGVYDVAEQDGRAFIVMEYVDGQSLASQIARERMPVDRIRAIGLQLASALAAAHLQGVIHRDLKPGNIQLTRDGSIKVLDFGVAKLSGPISSTTGATTGSAAAEATLGGTPGTTIYMSPEQLFGREVDGRSDIYSLGVILFVLATGRRPYEETGAVALALAMTSRPAPAANSINAAVPADLSGVIAKALQCEPDARYQTAREMEQALAAAQGAVTSSGLLAANVSPEATTRMGGAPAWTRWWKAAVAVSILLSAGFFARQPLMTRLGRPPAASLPARPAALAILPVDNPGGDLQAEYLGAGIVTVVAANFGSIPGLTVLSRASTAPYDTRRNDLAGMHREIGADYILDLALKSAAPRAALVARLRKPGTVTPLWEETISGDALAVEQAVLDGLARVLQRQVLSRRLSAAEYSRIRKVPTTSGEALRAYSEARALLGPSNSPSGTDKAVSLLQDALAKDPSFALAYAALGDAYWQKYELEKDPTLVGKATAAVTDALRIDPGLAPVHYSLGNMYMKTGRYQEAITALRRAIDIQPDSDESHNLLARVLSAKGDYRAAAEEAQRAVDIRPNWSNYFDQGQVEFAAAHRDNALTSFRRTTELNPTFAGGFLMLGLTYYMLGDLENAIGNYAHSIRLAPNAPAYSNLGLAYYRAKRYPEAIAAFTEAINRGPQQPLRYRNLADAYKAAGRLAEARDNYTKALNLARTQLTVNPRDAIMIALAALCEANLGQRAEAERHAAEAAALGPTNAELRFRLTKVYAVLNERSAAFATLRAAVSAGYEPNLAREDEELAPLRGREFEAALAAGLAARESSAGRQE